MSKSAVFSPFCRKGVKKDMYIRLCVMVDGGLAVTLDFGETRLPL